MPPSIPISILSLSTVSSLRHNCTPWLELIPEDFWIIGVAIFGSICIYPRGGIAYIDALFLSSGSATQSGLNTVNLNDLNTWQQIVLFIIPMLCNPIAINTFVVFLRLYWFEKRFQHIAAEAKRNRRSMTKSMSKSKGDRDIGREERGVQGRSIVVMHETTKPNGMTNDGDVPHDLTEHLRNAIAKDDSDGTDNAANEQSPGATGDTDSPTPLSHHQTQIRFADLVKPSHSRTSEENFPAPIHRNPEEHIAFLERQRNPDDNAVLRIPGPRDADAGVGPVMVENPDAHRTLSRRLSLFSSRRESEDLGPRNSYDNNLNTSGRRRNITIAEPARPSLSEHVTKDVRTGGPFRGMLRFRKPKVIPGEKLHEQRHPQRMNTLSSIKRTFSQANEESMPYLSWQPTIRRNSAFVDLTESQREELGGIEYRALKALALILSLYFWGFMILGWVGLVPWILESKTYGPVVTEIGQGRPWWGLFTGSSAFTDLGYTLTPDSMQSFQAAIWPLLLMSFLIIIGNTGFPIMLRLIIWVTSLYVPKHSGFWEELRFLLDHPRRCFTLLFPGKATWLLFWILVVLNGVDLIFFIILDVSVVLRRPILVADHVTAWKYCCYTPTPEHTSPRRLVPSSVHQNSWLWCRQPSCTTPCHTSFLPDHDVHISPPYRYLSPPNKCLRREGPRYLWLGCRRARRTSVTVLCGRPPPPTAVLRSLVYLPRTLYHLYRRGISPSERRPWFYVV